jgi:proteasome lid subunit RPN8/RPN11
MSVPELRLAGTDLEAIIEHCRRELPNEACGILGGKAGRVESVHPVQGTGPSPARFAMDPEGQFRALDEIQSAGLDVVGLYHSHPVGRAVPSPADVAGSFWPGTRLPNYPGAVQVIVSLQDRAAPVVKGYLLESGSFAEVRIVTDELEAAR